jgi:DNA-binding NtrC family response regulator
MSLDSGVLQIEQIVNSFVRIEDPMPDQRIIIIDSDAVFRRIAREKLEASGYIAGAAADAGQALKTLAENAHALAIIGLDPERPVELDVLQRILAENPDTALIVVSDPFVADAGAAAIALGASGWLTKPVHPNILQLAVDRALEYRQLRYEVRDLRSTLDRKYGFENIIARSGALLHVVDAAARAAQLEAPVLIRGEAGTGKELLAAVIHFNSRRKNGPFVPFYCPASGTQAESELFGTRGAKRIQSRFDQAEGGTLFLDEISELPLPVQIRLLEALQDRQRSAKRRPDVRIIAATHRNLQAMVEDGTFREDLYYKLAVIPVELAPLRERSEDVPALVRHFFALSQEKHGRPDMALPDSVLPFFCAYRWPGNIGELEQVIDRIVAFSQSDHVAISDLPEVLRRERVEADVLHLDLPPHGISLEGIEKSLILRALKKFNWNQSRAAKYLDLSRKTLIYRMEKFGLRTLSTEDARSAAHGVPVPSSDRAAV